MGQQAHPKHPSNRTGLKDLGHADDAIDRLTAENKALRVALIKCRVLAERAIAQDDELDAWALHRITAGALAGEE
jgi:hypothetical protein